MKCILSTLIPALFAALLLTACGNATSRVESLASDIEKNGNEWTDADQWEDAARDFFESCISIGESNFTEDQAKEFASACLDIAKAIASVDDRDARKALRSAMKRIEKDDDLGDRLKDAFETAKDRLEELDLKPEDLIDEDDIREAYGLLNTLM